MALPAIATLSTGIESDRMSSVQTGLANQGRDYNSGVYPQKGKQIILHYDLLYVWKAFFCGNLYQWNMVSTYYSSTIPHYLHRHTEFFVLSVLRINLSDKLVCHQEAVDLRQQVVSMCNNGTSQKCTI